MKAKALVGAQAGNSDRESKKSLLPNRQPLATTKIGFLLNLHARELASCLLAETLSEEFDVERRTVAAPSWWLGQTDENETSVETGGGIQRMDGWRTERDRDVGNAQRASSERKQVRGSRHGQAQPKPSLPRLEKYLIAGTTTCERVNAKPARTVNCRQRRTERRIQRVPMVDGHRARGANGKREVDYRSRASHDLVLRRPSLTIA